jgi:hypothetical protein
MVAACKAALVNRKDGKSGSSSRCLEWRGIGCRDEMMTIDGITNGFLAIVRLGVVARFVYCMVKLIGADDEAARYIKRSKNAVLFWILAEGVWSLKDVIFHYYQ